MSELFIGVKRLVAVDSSEFAYAELEIDAHSMLVAQGNIGKSSLINALRLFFLPECSMAHQATNFGFCDSNGDFYGSETTFQHYFPSKYSFLVLEYDKRLYDGETSCQILSAAPGRLRFERMFTSLSYQQLRHLFWQEGEDEDGIGERVDELSKQRVYDFIQKHDSKAALVRDPQKAASLLYASELGQTQYSLFPLNNVESQSIESLRALIKLLFVASSRNKKPFTNAIANIIEGSKKSSQDQLDFSIEAFKLRHENLKAEEAKLNNIINFESKRQKLQKQRDEFLQYLAALSQVRPSITWMKEGSKSLALDLQKLADKNATATAALDTANSALVDIDDQYRLDKKACKQRQKEHNLQQNIIQRFAELENEFAHESIDFIKSALHADLTASQDALAVLDGNVAREEKINSLDAQIDSYEQRKQQLNLALENSQFDLENQLDKPTLDKLHSINAGLAGANTGQALSTEDKQAISNFADLLAEKATHYDFYDYALTRSPFKQVKKEQQVERIEQELQVLQRRRKQLLEDVPSELHKQQNRKALIKAIELAEKDLKVLENYNYARRRVEDLTQEIDQLNLQIQSSEKQKEAAIKQAADKQQQASKSRDEYEACKREINRHKETLDRLERFANLHHQWLALVEDDGAFNGYLNDTQLNLLDTSAANLSPLQFDIISNLCAFVDAGIIDDKHGISGDAPLWHEINATFDEVQSAYANLDTQRHLFGRQIEEHNQTIGTKKEVIVQNYKVIKAFEREINQAFAGLTINNVSQVEFSVGIDRQFEALVKEFEQTNLFSQQMLSDEFYQRLLAFAERFFEQDDTFVLTMDKVITSFEPSVQLNNKSSKEDKKQSNSTNALIKLKLVQLLLKRLLAHAADTSFPIVHDEIANIDISQFTWWLNDLKAAGFNLIAAGTHSTSPELQATIGRRHVLDALSTYKPYHKERARVYWQGAEEFEGLDTLSQQEALV